MAFWLLYGGGCCRGGSSFRCSGAWKIFKKSLIVVCTEVLYVCAHCKLTFLFICYYTRGQASGSRGNKQRSAVGQLGSTRSGVLGEAVTLAAHLSLAVVSCGGRLGLDCDQTERRASCVHNVAETGKAWRHNRHSRAIIPRLFLQGQRSYCAHTRRRERGTGLAKKLCDFVICGCEFVGAAMWPL